MNLNIQISSNLASKGGVTYTYDGTHKHAVAGLSNGNAYSYDANGNQVTRTINGNTFTLTYDAENRMVAVSGNGLSASFLYDGDGRRVKSTINGVETVFVGNYYEATGGALNRSYYLGGARVAVRRAGVVYYPLTDHLGSTTVTTDASGNVNSELRYKPFGETRLASGTTPTEYQFTGQYSNASDFGLYFYNARWYDGQLGRFTQADTVMPDPYNSLDYDRYGYGRSNPLKYSDPSGHKACDDYEHDSCVTWTRDNILSHLGITVKGVSGKPRDAIVDAALISADILGRIFGDGGNGAFTQLHGSITINISNEKIDPAVGNCGTIGGTITCSQIPNTSNTLHELGHVFDNHSGLIASGGLNSPEDMVKGFFYRSTEGFIFGDQRGLEHPPSMDVDQTGFGARAEQWADTYMNFFLSGTGDPNHGFTNTTAGLNRIQNIINIINNIYNGLP